MIRATAYRRIRKLAAELTTHAAEDVKNRNDDAHEDDEGEQPAASRVMIEWPNGAPLLRALRELRGFAFSRLLPWVRYKRKAHDGPLNCSARSPYV